MLMRHEAALAYYRDAASLAKTPEDSRRAAWGQVAIAMLSAHSPSLEKLIASFDELRDDSAESTLRLAGAILALATRRVGLERHAREQAMYLHLVPRANDGMATTFFLYRLSIAYFMSGQYSLAYRVAVDGHEEASRKAVDFALPHMTASMAAASIGLRRFRNAETLLAQLRRELASTDSRFEEANGQLLAARLAMSRGATEIAQPILQRAVGSAPTIPLRAEALGLRCLCAAAARDFNAARSDAEAVKGLSDESQAQVLTKLAMTMVSLEEDDDASDALGGAAEAVLTTENYDSLVIAMRLYPALLTAFAKSGTLSTDNARENPYELARLQIG